MKIIQRKNKVYEDLKGKSHDQAKGKIADKKKRLRQLEQEISEAHEELKVKSRENEKLSQESKQLKKMMPKEIPKSTHSSMLNGKSELDESKNGRFGQHDEEWSGDLEEVNESDEDNAEVGFGNMKDMGAGMHDPALEEPMEL